MPDHGLLSQFALLFSVVFLHFFTHYVLNDSIVWAHEAARRELYPSVIAARFKAAFLPLMTLFIIVGDIVSGAFTPTEADIGAAAYAQILGTMLY